MAEYAEDKHDVHAAARGFSPETDRAMLHEKALRQRHLSFVLERRGPFLQWNKGRVSQMMPLTFCWQDFHWRQKQKFFEKKQKKTKELSCEMI